MKRKLTCIFSILLSLALTLYLVYYLCDDRNGKHLKDKLNGFFLLLVIFSGSAILGMIFILLDPPKEKKNKRKHPAKHNR